MAKINRILIGLLLMLNLVFVSAAWGDIETDTEVVIEDVIEEVDTTVDSSVLETNESSGEEIVSATKHTKYFYMAVGLGALGALLLVFFIYLFIRGPSSKW